MNFQIVLLVTAGDNNSKVHTNKNNIVCESFYFNVHQEDEKIGLVKLVLFGYNNKQRF